MNKKNDQNATGLCVSSFGYFSQDNWMARFRCSASHGRVHQSVGFSKFNFNCKLGEPCVCVFFCVYLGPSHTSRQTIFCCNNFVWHHIGLLLISNENDIARWMNTSFNLMLSTVAADDQLNGQKKSACRKRDSESGKNIQMNTL